MLPADTIIYNFEQLSDTSHWNTPAQRALLGGFQVWDYSQRNVDYLKRQSPRFDPKLVPLGFSGKLSRIQKADLQDIDVLFYGSVNGRRRRILDDLEVAELNVVQLFKVYGEQRDAYIARAKIVLNLHFFDTQIFEIARVSYLLANRKAVVSEIGPDTEIDGDLGDALAFAKYQDLVQTCVDLVHDDAARADLEEAGYAAFSAREEFKILEPILKEEPVPNMQTAHVTASPLAETIPASLNIGSGKDFRHDCVNLDYLGKWDPDIVTDLSRTDLIGTSFETDRFGALELQKNMFDTIICNDVVEHIPDLVSAMTNCLDLLCVGGKMNILVPYDLSFGAWQDPTHVRAFNERSWLYYTDWYWYLGWSEARFHLRKMDFNLSTVGQTLLKGGLDQEVLIRAPRAVDSMSVVLEKQLLTEQEKDLLVRAQSR